MWDFIVTLFWLAVIAAAVMGYFAFKGYNGLRSHSEEVREAWSNIGVAAKKQVSLIKQLIEVVKGYQESEKLVVLKVSEDVSSAAAVAQLHQQSGFVMSSVMGMAQKFPELRSSEQYQRLIGSMQECESTLERARQRYNGSVRAYNTLRSSIPNVFYAGPLGFGTAPYLEFAGNDLQASIGELQSFASDEDGERINQLLGAAGASAKRLGAKALGGGMQIATKAIEGGKSLAEAARAGAQADNGESREPAILDLPPAASRGRYCRECGTAQELTAKFCESCGTAIGAAST
jgi:hypothetical protein